MKTIAIIALVLLAGCGQQDGYIPVRITYVATQAELQHHCGKDFLPEPAGCALGGNMVTPPGPCFIYILTPTGRKPSFDQHRIMETMGHELKHCFDGPVHT